MKIESLVESRYAYIQTECDDECPDCSHQPHVESDYCRRRDNDLVEKLAEDDNIECCKTIDLMWNVYGSCIACSQDLLCGRGVTENPDTFFDDNGNSRYCDFTSERDIFDV